MKVQFLSNSCTLRFQNLCNKISSFHFNSKKFLSQHTKFCIRLNRIDIHATSLTTENCIHKFSDKCFPYSSSWCYAAFNIHSLTLRTHVPEQNWTRQYFHILKIENRPSLIVKCDISFVFLLDLSPAQTFARSQQRVGEHKENLIEFSVLCWLLAFFLTRLWFSDAEWVSDEVGTGGWKRPYHTIVGQLLSSSPEHSKMILTIVSIQRTKKMSLMIFKCCCCCYGVRNLRRKKFSHQNEMKRSSFSPPNTFCVNNSQTLSMLSLIFRCRDNGKIRFIFHSSSSYQHKHHQQNWIFYIVIRSIISFLILTILSLHCI